MKKKKVFLDIGEGVHSDPRLMAYVRKNFLVTKNPADAEFILVMGGDGKMMRSVHQYGMDGKPLFGLNFGHLGFLLNKPEIGVLEEFRRGEVQIIKVKMLKARLYDTRNREIGIAYAFNDFYFERVNPQSAKIQIFVDGKKYFDPLICDGVIVCTPAGTAAYNASAGGKIIHPNSRRLTMTGICPMVLHHWRTSQYPEKVKITFRAIELEKRPVRFIADGKIISNVAKAEIECSNKVAQLVFARSCDFRYKIFELMFNEEKDK